MSQGLCPKCGAAIDLSARQNETKCRSCGNLVELQQAEAEWNKVQNSNAGGAPPTTGAELPPSVMELIRKGDSQKIAAIVELGTLKPGMGLAEAKKLVEEAGMRMGTMSAPKSGCFIATACYDDYDHPIVLELRSFRDNYLEPSSAGRASVRWYYRWSPPLANLIARSKTRRILAGALLVHPALLIARAIKTIKWRAR